MVVRPQLLRESRFRTSNSAQHRVMVPFTRSVHQSVLYERDAPSPLHYPARPGDEVVEHKVV